MIGDVPHVIASVEVSRALPAKERAMPSGTDNPSRGSGAALAIALLVVGLLPVLYFLSIGPVAWFHQSGPDPAWIDASSLWQGTFGSG